MVHSFACTCLVYILFNQYFIIYPCLIFYYARAYTYTHTHYIYVYYVYIVYFYLNNALLYYVCTHLFITDIFLNSLRKSH